MSKRQIQLNIKWEDPSIKEGTNYIEGFEKRNFVVPTEAEFNDLYNQIRQVIIDFFKP